MTAIVSSALVTQTLRSAPALVREATLSHRVLRAAMLMLAGGALAASASAATLTVSWDDNSTAEDGFAVERSRDGVTFSQVATLPANSTNYTDADLSVGQYWYRVRAFSGASYSAYSETANYTLVADVTKPTPTPTPTPIPAPSNPTPPTTSTPTGTVLTGTVISSAPWNNISTYAGSKVFDNDTASFFSGRSSDALVYVGQDFGVAQKVDAIGFFPRAGFADRMNGGKFCGANKADLSDAVTLYTVSSTPADGTWQNVTLTASATSYRYVYFTTSSFNYGDVAEIHFYSNSPATLTPPPSTSSPVGFLTGTTISSGSWDNLPAYVGSKVFDGDTNSFFSGKATDALVYVGLDLGTAKVIDAVSFFPRTGMSWRMNGGRFRGANKADLSDAVTLYTVPAAPVEGKFTDVTLPASTQAYRYVFYTTVSSNYGDVAEIELYGHALSIPTAGAQLVGTTISSSPWDNQVAYQGSMATDGDTSTFFTGRSTDALIYVGLDLGSAKSVGAIEFFPRTGFSSRMIGGQFKGANKADLSDAVTLYTITSAPAEGQWKKATLPAASASYRYVFYTTVSANYGDVADLKFYAP